jgi:probable phosphoglycerate mutase
MKIFFIRHGETTGDVEKRLGGAYDDHLTLKGHDQAEALAAKLADKGIELIHISPMIRTQETAAYLTAKIKCETITDPDLKERDQYGFLTGLVKSYAETRYSDIMFQLRNPLFNLEDAETYEDFKNRIVAAFERITNDESHKVIAVLWHGGPMRILFRHILELGEIKYSDCGYVALEKGADGSFAVVEKEGIEF